MNTINQETVGCFLFNASVFRLQSEQAFTKKYINGEYISVDGLYTHPDSTHTIDNTGKKHYSTRHGGKNIFDRRKLSLLIDGMVLTGRFLDMFDNRMHYYVNDADVLTMANISLVEIEYNDALKSVKTYDGHAMNKNIYSLVVNIPMPQMDVVAPKLVSY